MTSAPPPPPQKIRQGKRITIGVSLLSSPFVFVATLVVTPEIVSVVDVEKLGNEVIMGRSVDVLVIGGLVVP